MNGISAMDRAKRAIVCYSLTVVLAVVSGLLLAVSGILCPLIAIAVFTSGAS